MGLLELDPCGAIKPSTELLGNASETWHEEDHGNKNKPSIILGSMCRSNHTHLEKDLFRNSLAELRVDWIDLSRLQDDQSTAGASKNEYSPSWTVFLVPMRTNSGQKKWSNVTEA